MLDGGELDVSVRRRRGLGSGRGPGQENRTGVPGTSMEKKDKPFPRLNIHSAFWILSSIAITYYIEFFKTVKEIIQKESGWFVLGSCLLAVSLSVAFYCIIYLEWYHGIADYETSYPTLVPITTACFIAAAVRCFCCFTSCGSSEPAWFSQQNEAVQKQSCSTLDSLGAFRRSHLEAIQVHETSMDIHSSFNISLWPVWSFLTPLVLFIQFMGIVMLVSLLG